MATSKIEPEKGADKEHGRVVQPVEADFVQVGEGWRPEGPAAGLWGVYVEIMKKLFTTTGAAGQHTDERACTNVAH